MTQAESEKTAGAMSDHETAALILAGIARAVVQSPDKVAVQSLAESEGALLTLRVDPQDFETVMGSGGRTARSLRTVLTALGKPSGQRFSRDIQTRSH